MIINPDKIRMALTKWIWNVSINLPSSAAQGIRNLELSTHRVVHSLIINLCSQKRSKNSHKKVPVQSEIIVGGMFDSEPWSHV